MNFATTSVEGTISDPGYDIDNDKKSVYMPVQRERWIRGYALRLKPSDYYSCYSMIL